MEHSNGKTSGIIEVIKQIEGRWGYLTTITKAQIRTLINRNVLQLELFENEIIEVQTEDNVRYILRKNKHRAEDELLNK